MHDARRLGTAVSYEEREPVYIARAEEKKILINMTKVRTKPKCPVLPSPKDSQIS